MDGYNDKQTFDFIRRTMQMHEDVFRHQVRELHRLYSIQKTLMNELNKEMETNTRYWMAMCSSNIKHQQFFIDQQMQTTGGCSFTDDHPISKEISPGGSYSDEPIKITRVLDLEKPAEDGTTDDYQAGPSTFRPQKSNKFRLITNNNSDEDNEVQLTLSVGDSSTSSNRVPKICHYSQGQEHGSPTSFRSERGEDGSAPTTPMSSSSTATFDQERNRRPHWLFQGLSINRT